MSRPLSQIPPPRLAPLLFQFGSKGGEVLNVHTWCAVYIVVMYVRRMDSVVCFRDVKKGGPVMYSCFPLVSKLLT